MKRKGRCRRDISKDETRFTTYRDVGQFRIRSPPVGTLVEFVEITATGPDDGKESVLAAFDHGLCVGIRGGEGWAWEEPSPGERKGRYILEKGKTHRHQRVAFAKRPGLHFTSQLLLRILLAEDLYWLRHE